MKVIIMADGFETMGGFDLEPNGLKIFADTEEGNKKAKEYFDEKPFSLMTGGRKPVRMEVIE